MLIELAEEFQKRLLPAICQEVATGEIATEAATLVAR